MRQFGIAIIITALLLTSALFAQTVNLPPASVVSPQAGYLTWTLPSDCTTTTPCTITLYRQAAASCPATLPTSGWTSITSGVAQATSCTDPGVAANTSYIYVAETQRGGLNSGPSNCVVVPVGAPATVPGTLLNLAGTAR